MGLFFILYLAAFSVQAQTSHQIPYRGHLELNGAPQNGEFDFQVHIQDLTGTDLWTEEFVGVQVAVGRFSLILGQDTVNNPLDDAIWQNDELYLAIEVKATGEPDYTALGGRQQILEVPFAARSHAAKNYRVYGNLTVDGTTNLQGLDVDGAADLSSLTVSGGSSLNGTTSVSNLQFSDIHNQSGGSGLSCVIRSASGNDDTTVACQSGETMTGCHCYASGTDSGRCDNFMNGGNCTVDDCSAGSACTVQAFCCRIK